MTRRSRLPTLRPVVRLLERTGPAPLTTGEHQRARGAEWERLRTSVLADAKGLCQCDECKALGRVRPAREVDHVRPLWEGGTNDRDNLQAIATECHVAKSKAEAARRARGGS